MKRVYQSTTRLVGAWVVVLHHASSTKKLLAEAKNRSYVLPTTHSKVGASARV
jgi:hypothetical protein